MQAALAANGNGAPAVRATPIVAANDGDGEEWLAHPLGIALRRQTEEEELALRREVPLKQQDGAYIPSRTGCEKYCHNVLETAVKKVAISTRVLGARWGTIPSCWSSLSVKKKEQASRALGEAGEALEGRQQQWEQLVVELTYCEQRVQETFERLSVLHSSEKGKADLFITKAWESYWRRMELIDWMSRMNKG